MATGTLTGQTIANTYKSILKVTGTTAGGETLHATTLKIIEDGDGNPTPIQLAQNRLEIVPTANHANAFEVSQTDGTQILNIASDTPAATLIAPLTVGADGAGHDVILYSDTSGDNFTWDASAECLIITGTDGAQSLKVADGDLVVVDKIYLYDNDGGEYLSGDGTDLTITSGNDIALAVGAAGSAYCSGVGGTSNTVFGVDAGIGLEAGSNYNVLLGDAVGDASMADATNNAAVGWSALSGLTSGDANSVLGYKSGFAITKGRYNIAIGSDALVAETIGDRSIAIGSSALGLQVMGSDNLVSGNIGIGYDSGYYNQTGTNNTWVGYLAGAGATGQNNSSNVGVGMSALWKITSGSENVAVGHLAGDAILAGASNVAIGKGAISTSTAASRMVGIGQGAIGNADTTAAAIGTVAVGMDSLLSLTSGAGNLAIGYQTLMEHTEGSRNIAIGHQAMYNTWDGTADDTRESSDNVAIGYQSMGGAWTDADADDTDMNTNNTAVGNYTMDGAMASAQQNTGVGYNSLGALISGNRNVAIGMNSLQGVTTGQTEGNVGLGYAAGGAIQTGDGNVSIGSASMDSSHAAQADCVVIGTRAGDALNATAADGLVAIGRSAAGAVTNGARNTAVGYNALILCTTGIDNTIVGNRAGDALVGGSDYNTAVGSAALGAANHDTSHYNTCFGYNAGDVITGGKENTCIGGATDTGAADAINQTAIGFNCTAVDDDDSVTLGNTSVDDVYMSQDGDAEVHCGTLAVGHGTGSTAGSGCLAEIGDPETGPGGSLFKIFSMNEDTATTFFTIAGSNLWAGLIEVCWNATDDTNRSGYQLSRFAYDDTFTSLINSAQNSTITLSLSTNDMQVSLTGAGSSVYRIKIRMMGGSRA